MHGRKKVKPLVKKRGKSALPLVPDASLKVACATEWKLGWSEEGARYSHMMVYDDELLHLTSHFGRFRAEVHDGVALQVVRSRMAFSYKELRSESEEADVGGGTPSFSDFWPVRVTFALDMAFKKPHRLVWGLNDREFLLTVVRPSLPHFDFDLPNCPRLLPIDKQLFQHVGIVNLWP